jgi:hypothetical protein
MNEIGFLSKFAELIDCRRLILIVQRLTVLLRCFFNLQTTTIGHLMSIQHGLRVFGLQKQHKLKYL